VVELRPLFFWDMVLFHLVSAQLVVSSARVQFFNP